ncbi:Hypothetical protein NTJ_15237 [Nesidiocoris tenuis]|uniref:RING-type domain-containing protein n=1 Tax=Nesidiocoris tenuis TaxID=355587 RepID=A0ABN7BDG3_9HEMI|nr:Hypothetical protein NTJ_15237 [Nesidiocoris tenuis]
MGDVLYCNAPNCGAPLLNDAWATTCKHVFCLKHGTEHFHNKRPQSDCPVCDETLVRGRDVKLASSNVNRLCLAGLRPEKILSLLEFNMKLWKQQLDTQRTVDSARIQNLTKEVQETEEKYKRIFKAKEEFLDRQIATLESKCRRLALKLNQKTREIELKNKSMKEETMATYEARQYSPVPSRRSTSTSSLFNLDFLNLDLDSGSFEFDTNLP